MRAVNLIPTEHRRGPLAGQGGVVASYAILGVLGVILLAVVMIVLTNNKISDRKAEAAKLEVQAQDAKTRASALQSFSSFRSLADLRSATVTSLAQSRFDWERVMRELSIVMPTDVWLTKLDGTVLPDVTLDDGASLASRASVAGPAIEMVGCASSQDSVAEFVASLEDIDGVTRVGVQSSNKSENAESTNGSSSGSGAGSVDECRTRAFIAKFELVVAFDDAAVPAAAAEGAAPAPPTAPSSPPPSTPNGIGDAQQQEATARQSQKQQSDKSKRAIKNYVPGQ